MGALGRRLRAAILGAGVALLTASPAYAVHDDLIFQVDGDVGKLTCGGAFTGQIGCTGDDWNILYSCPATGTLGQCTKATPGTNNTASAIADLVTDGLNKSTFTTGASKDEKDVSVWKWTDGSVPDKDDLVQAFGALYTDSTGGKVIYFGANRLAVNGDAQIGFWFLQNATFLCGDPAVTGTCVAGTFVGRDGKPVSHKLGDILILSNFVQGGGSSNIQVYKVVQITPGTCPSGSVETSAGSGDICLQQLINGSAGLNGVCNINSPGGIPDDAACAATNGGPVAALDPRFVPKSGTAGTYPTVGFFEGGLDLAVIPGLGDECFPSFLVETRSSQSITATLKDFTLGKFENCSSGVKTEIHLVGEVSPFPDIQCQAGQTCTSIHSTDSIFDKAIVTGTLGAPAPTGTVTFTYYPNGTCTAPGTDETVNLNTGTLDATTNSVTVKTTNKTVAPTAVSFSATYSGDGRYPPGEDGCEFITVKSSPTLGTTPSPSSGTVGVTLNDSATLTGATNPTGSITFNLYPPSDATCSGTPSFTQTVALSGASASTTTGFATNATGTWRWTASYPGDAGNEAASSGCQAEQVTVGPASPSLVTTPSAGGVIGVTLNDSGTLSNGYNPTGSITFKLFDPDKPSCDAGTERYSQTVTVSGNGTYSTNPPGPGFVTDKAGTWNWTATYSGDSNNNTASSGCGAEAVTVTAASPSAVTHPSLTVINNDSATLSGGVSPTGTLTFKLFRGTIASPPTCGAGTEIASFPVTVNNGNATYSTNNSTALSVTADTVFRWTVNYNGDNNNNGFTTACTAEQVSIDITPNP